MRWVGDCSEASSLLPNRPRPLTTPTPTPSLSQTPLLGILPTSLLHTPPADTLGYLNHHLARRSCGSQTLATRRVAEPQPHHVPYQLPNHLSHKARHSSTLAHLFRFPVPVRLPTLLATRAVILTTLTFKVIKKEINMLTDTIEEKVVTVGT